MEPEIKSLKKLSLIALYVILLSFKITGGADAATAILFKVEGAVEIVSENKKLQAKAGMTLSPGDTVKAIQGSASILLSNGTIRHLEDGQSYTVKSESAGSSESTVVSRLMDTIKETTQAGSGPRVKGTVLAKEEEKQDDTSAAYRKIDKFNKGQTGISKKIIIIQPYNSKVLPDDVSFTWEKYEGPKFFKITISSDARKTFYKFYTKTTGDSASMPDAAPQLEYGKRYYWTLEGLGAKNREAVASEQLWFEVLSAEEAEIVKRDIGIVEKIEGASQEDDILLKTNLYISHGLYHEAEKILASYMWENPASMSIKDTLIRVYEQMENVPKARSLF